MCPKIPLMTEFGGNMWGNISGMVAKIKDGILGLNILPKLHLLHIFVLATEWGNTLLP